MWLSCHWWLDLGPDRSAERAAGPHPAQGKTTLKWDENGELTALDMARIVDRLTQPELQRCDLAPF